MAHSYTVDAVRGVVLVRVFGVLTPASVQAAEAEFRADARIKSTFAALFDLTDVTSVDAIGSADVRSLATAPVMVFARRAFVAPSPAAFGLCRMFATLRELKDQSEPIGVFRTLADAAQWLNLVA